MVDSLKLKVWSPHDNLGFGTLALFRSQRFLAMISAVLAIFTMLAGISNYTANPGMHPTFTWIDEVSMANKNQSSPNCM